MRPWLHVEPLLERHVEHTRKFELAIPLARQIAHNIKFELEIYVVNTLLFVYICFVQKQWKGSGGGKGAWWSEKAGEVNR